jgi:hypothetical protein
MLKFLFGNKTRLAWTSYKIAVRVGLVTCLVKQIESCLFKQVFNSYSLRQLEKFAKIVNIAKI